MLNGIAVSNGIAIGKVFKYERPMIKFKKIKGETSEELAIFEHALKQTVKEIIRIKEKASKYLGEEELAIFDAHLMMVNDIDYCGRIKEYIINGSNADMAVKCVKDYYVSKFESSDNEYFRDKALDIKDISYHLICNIQGLTIPDLSLVDEKVIIISNELSPSDTARLDKQYALGFCTVGGSKTSHTAIMARTLGLPAIVGVKNIMQEVSGGDTLIIDAYDGEIIINPDLMTIEKYHQKQQLRNEAKEELMILANLPSLTLDNHFIDIAANIGNDNDVSSVIKVGADSIGLYRTEFLYMNSSKDFPSEESQFEAYKNVLSCMKGKKVVVRTLDIGGDKNLNYYNFPKELNPFLGYRAIRMSLDCEDVFRTQLRALLKASIYGNLAIMFPLISTVNEFLRAKDILEDERIKLINEGFMVSDDIEVGMMVETPSSAIMADHFAKYADFFSIGTNDLVQYTMAADRTSENVTYLYQPLNPAILKMIKLVIDAAHKHGKWCGMCGEMTDDNIAIPILLGMGIDELSMNHNSILASRKQIRSLSKADLLDLASDVLNFDTEEEVISYTRKKLNL